MTPFEVRTPGATLAVRRLDGERGPPVIVLHGGPGMVGYIHGLSGLLAGRARVFDYGQRGTTPSPSDGPFTLRDHVQDLRAVIAAACPDVRPILLGHLFGGLLALLCAADHGDAIDRVIAVGCAPLSPAAGLEMDQRILARLSPDEVARFGTLGAQRRDPTRSQAEQRDADVQLQRIFMGAMLGPQAHPGPPGEGRSPLIEPRNLPACFEANEDFLSFRNSGQLAHALRRIECPISVIHGDDDAIPLHGVMDVLAAHTTRFAGHVLRGASHFPWLDADPSTFLRVFDECLA